MGNTRVKTGHSSKTKHSSGYHPGFTTPTCCDETFFRLSRPGPETKISPNHSDMHATYVPAEPYGNF